MLKHPIGRLRLTGMLEGISFLALLGVGMPLKYLGGDPSGVKLLGPVHGLLFIAYVVLVFEASTTLGWPLRRAGGLLLASLLPFGPFVVDGRLRREQHAPADPEAQATPPSAP